jgi:hypothetical protein
MPRYMIIVKATEESEAGVMPQDAQLAEMAKYNEELAKAGAMLDGAGLQPTSKGWRVQYTGGKRTVVDGPFPETRELIAGYWIIRTRTREEAIEWTRRIPNPAFGQDCHVEVRQLFELEDFEQTDAIQRFRDLEPPRQNAAV